MNTLILKLGLFFILLFFLACRPDSNRTGAELNGKSTTQEKIKIESQGNNKTVTFTKGGYYRELAKYTNFSRKDIRSVRSIDRDFRNKRKALIKEKKWRGKANKSFRRNLRKQKRATLKKVLDPNKFRLKKQFDQKWRQARKSSKKK